MLRLNRLLCTAAVVATAACSGDSRSPVAPADAPSREILDAARSTLVQGFYWLPPLVPQPVFSGTFDPTVSPTVQVCELAGPPPSTCTSTVVAEFTKTSGTGGQVVTVSTSGGYYQANWHTDLSNLDPAKYYRISVFVNGTEFGHADVDPVNTGKELKNVDTDELIPLLDGRTLPIKFRIETGAGPTQRAPAASADAYATVENTALAVPDGGTDLLANDDLGVPAATLASFGGGSLGGAVTDHTAGSTASFGSGGSLVVNADGSFTFTPAAGFSGSFTFGYRVSNAAGTSDATVTITVNARPTAVDDAPAAGSAPGDPYHAPFNSGLSLPAPGILQNDVLGVPAATVASFGGGSLGGAVTDQAAGSTAAFGSGGSLAVNADGSLVFTPPAGFTGLFTFEYRISNAVDSDVGQATIAVGARPGAQDDAYGPTLIGNVPVNTASSTGFSVRANDAGDGVTLALTSVSNGTAILDLATGTFVFDPAPGYEGPAGFSYSATNGFGTVTASVSLNVSGVIWFVDNGAGAGSGTLSAPFNSIAAFNAANDGAGAHPAAGDAVFIHESGTSYTGPLTLLDGQRVIGQDASASLAALAGLTPPADSDLPDTDGANAAVVNVVSAANGIDLAQNNELHGLRVGNTTGTGIAGAGFGTLAVSDVTVNTTGPALALSNGTLAADFKGVSSSGGAVNVSLAGVGGTADLGIGALSGSTVAAFQVQGGSGSLAYAGSIATTAGRSVAVSGRTGGSVTLSGAIDDTGTGILVLDNSGGTVAFTGASKTVSTGAGAGVTLAGNTGATVQFAGGGLAVSTTTGAGFSATGGGTVQVTGANNTITSAGGVALNVADADIGASGITFRSISANGGVSGIVLSNTGSANGLNVTGSGAAGSGGTIQNTSGPGISLEGTSSPSFSHIAVQNTGRSGIQGTGVVNFTLAGSTITGTGSAADDANLDFFANTAPGSENNLAGTVSITGNTLSAPHYHNVHIQSWSGTIASLTITGNVLTNSSTLGGSGIRVLAVGSGGTVAKITRAMIDDNQISQVPSGVGLFIQCGNAIAGGPLGTCGTEGSGTDVVAVTNNRVWGASAASRIGAEGVVATLNGRGEANFNVSGNDVRHTTGRAMAMSVFGQGRMTSTVANNTVIANNAFGSTGIEVGADSTASMASFASHRATVTGNSVSQTDGVGIYAIARGSSDTLRVRVQNNTVAAPLSGFRPGIRIDSGSTLGNTTVCLNASGNTSAGSGGAAGIGVRKQGTNPAVNVFGISGIGSPSPTNADVVAYLNGQNPAGSGTLILSGSGYGSCSLP
ncbi:MAG: cadherin-like domain-containing protein [Gemmatimonadota bacterium]